ncbi:SPFH domain-containing protein, partial [uncultured Desulfovibrio sp.]|uniref:SPFH domain-containing protein n=1 Tax=uncultured Desulfovibrio sp. TaxID=167968 RepID=UPI00260AD468
GPGQGCLLVYEGKIVAQVAEQTSLSLRTANHPFVTTLSRFATLFESEHKVQLYFYRTTLFTGVRWGTPLPVRYLDPVYQLPLAVGMHGTFSFRLADPQTAFLKLCAGESRVDLARIKSIFDALLPQFIVTTLAGAAYSCLDIDRHLDEIGAGIHARLTQAVADWGFAVPDFSVNGSILDAETRKTLGEVFAMRSRQKAADEVHLSYEQLERLRALRDMAASAADFEAEGAPLRFFFKDGSKFRPSDFRPFPSTLAFEAEGGQALAARLAEELELVNPDNLPLVLVVNGRGEVVFLSQGYSIGLGAQVLKQLK